jgi:hypothetical protein
MIVKLKKENSLKAYYLSNDKEYTAEVVDREWGSKWYKIECDDGYIREFSDNHFITIEEIRDKRLNDLGI